MFFCEFWICSKNLDHVEYSNIVEYSRNYENSYFSKKITFLNTFRILLVNLMILHQKKHFECSSANFGFGKKILDHLEYSISNFDFSQKSRFSPYFNILHTNDVQKKEQECLLDNVEYPMSEEGYSRIHT